MLGGGVPTLLPMLLLLQEELQISHGAREKELNKQRTVDRARVRDPSNRQKIVSLLGIFISSHYLYVHTTVVILPVTLLV